MRGGGDTEREENVEEGMDQRLKKHISQEHNYTQDLKVEDNGRGSKSVVVNMNMVKAKALRDWNGLEELVRHNTRTEVGGRGHPTSDGLTK